MERFKEFRDIGIKIVSYDELLVVALVAFIVGGALGSWWGRRAERRSWVRWLAKQKFYREVIEED